MRKVLILFALLAAPAALAECPPASEQAEARAEALSALAAAQTPAEAKRHSDAMWQIWLTAPDARAQDLIDRAMARRESYALAEAEALLDELIAYCPDYAEGYNQRAFVRFLRGHHDRALEDLEEVLARDRYHFGALSGKALALIAQGRARLAQAPLRRAVEIHPFLAERVYLLPDDDDPI